MNVMTDIAHHADPAQAMQSLEPVVFLPGLLCDQALWRHQIDALADVCAPFVADLTLDNTIEAMARRTLAVAPPRFSLIGLSMGGYVAMEMVRLAPDRVRRLALVDTTARADTPERTARRRAGIGSLRRGVFLGITRRLLEDLVHPDHLDDHVAATMRTMASRVGKEAFLRQQHAIMRRPNAAAHLGAIRVETMIVVGEGDNLTPVAHAHEMHAAVAGSLLHIIPRCGHMPALEEPDRLSALIRRWLDRGRFGDRNDLMTGLTPGRLPPEHETSSPPLSQP